MAAGLRVYPDDEKILDEVSKEMTEVIAEIRRLEKRRGSGTNVNHNFPIE